MVPLQGACQEWSAFLQRPAITWGWQVGKSKKAALFFLLLFAEDLIGWGTRKGAHTSRAKMTRRSCSVSQPSVSWRVQRFPLQLVESFSWKESKNPLVPHLKWANEESWWHRKQQQFVRHTANKVWDPIIYTRSGRQLKFKCPCKCRPQSWQTNYIV